MHLITWIRMKILKNFVRCDRNISYVLQKWNMNLVKLYRDSCTCKYLAIKIHINSLWPGNAIWRQRSWSKLAHMRQDCCICSIHDDVIKWKQFRVTGPLCGEFNKGQWGGALMFSLICARTNGSINNREASDLRRNCAHYDVTVILPP